MIHARGDGCIVCRASIDTVEQGEQLHFADWMHLQTFSNCLCEQATFLKLSVDNLVDTDQLDLMNGKRICDAHKRIPQISETTHQVELMNI